MRYLRSDIPSFIQISNAEPHGVHTLGINKPKAGANHVVDRGYVDFAHVLQRAGAVRNARVNRRIDSYHLFSVQAVRLSAIFCNQVTQLGSTYTSQGQSEVML